MTDTTTIAVDLETYQALQGRKLPGESFNDVIKRELDL